MPFAAEELTRRFYEWERRGRGWLQWPARVALEPPFRPFYGHFLLPPQRPDDGRKETAFSRLLDSFSGNTPALPQPALPEELFAEPDPQFTTDDEEVSEFAIALPEGTRVERDAAEGFLTTIRGSRRPVAFEIVGTPNRIVLQLAARRPEGPHMEEAIRAFFPSSGVAESEASLLGAWRDAGSRIAIRECALAREFMLPLRTFAKSDPDPLIGVLAALGPLRDGECGALQILFEPTREEWAESVRRAVIDGEGRPFFMDAPDLTRLALEKVANPLFAVVIRLAATAREKGRASAIVDQLGAALAHFGRADGNELVFIRNDIDADLEDDLLSRSSHRSGMLLSSGELVAFVHPPSASVVSPKLVRRVRKTKATPLSSVGGHITLGTNEHAGRAVEVGLTADERMRHLHVVGASGTGKSTFLLDLILQSVARGRGLGLIDPHGDLVDEVAARIPDDRIDDVVYLDAADAEHPIGFNLLAAHSDLEATLLASDLVGIFRRLSTSWGDQMQAVLANAVQAFLSSRTGGSLADLRRFLIEPDYRREFLATVEDEEVAYYWAKEFPLLVGKPAGPILTRLDGFLRPKPLRAMLTQRESRLDFREILDGGRIFLAKLAQGAIGKENAALLGSLLVAKFHQAAISRQEIAARERRDFDLVIDEFQEVVTPSVADILAGTRKYRLGLTAAHQAMRPVFEADAAVAAALLANAATRVIFRVGEDDAKRFAEGFASFDASALTSLGVGEVIARIDRADHDFNLKTRMLPPIDPSVAATRRERVIEASRRRFASPRSPTTMRSAQPSPPPPKRPSGTPKEELRRLMREVDPPKKES